MKKPKLAIGPGTAVALAGVFVVLALGIYQGRGDSSNVEALRERAEADAPPPPLRKPRPGDLLQLNLTDEQRTRIQAIQREWLQTEASLVAQMHATTPQPERSSVEGLKTDLRGYSELSRVHDAERRRLYDQALAVLDPAQRKAVQP